MEPTAHGIELSHGDHIGNDTPDCCDTEMTNTSSGTPERTYKCDECGTTVNVDNLGLVSDIQ